MADRFGSDGHFLPLVEEFYTLQGEGYNSGLAAWFIRLGGCDVGCSWCDSRFTWNPELHPLVSTDEIVAKASGSGTDSVVVTGGEPLIWNLDYLCSELKNRGMKTFIETSGSYILSGNWDWICLSPKRNMPPLDGIFMHANELKVIIQQEEDFLWAEENSSRVGNSCHLYLQPEWSRYGKIVPVIIDYIKKNHKWKISLQSHKFMHIP